MLLPGLLFLLSGLLDTKPAPILADIRIDNKGTYRFLVDTGAETSVIDPALAAELRLQPRFRVELITQHGTRIVPATLVNTITLGDKALREMEIVFCDVGELRRLDPSIRGILGLNALTGLDFTLLPGDRRLDHSAERPIGEVVPFSWVEGRISVKARMGDETLTLILDSGATHMVLFRTPAVMANTKPVSATFGTLDGARRVTPTRWTADMFFTERLRIGMLPAAIVERKDTQVEGLLPASAFKKIFVDQARNELVLVR